MPSSRARPDGTLALVYLQHNVTGNLMLKIMQKSCRESIKTLQLLTQPSLYIFETTLFCTSKCGKTTCRDIHSYEIRRRKIYRTGQKRMAVSKRHPSQVGIHFINKLQCRDLITQGAPNSYNTLFSVTGIL
ncbi:hypothetical protein J6590_085483 [Homalodisca vitripennis]|nr:hypothetical protein J6590_085483 [Homalodisca vitripennis]